MTIESFVTRGLEAAPFKGVHGVITRTAQSAQVSGRRVLALARLIDRAGSALDDIAELRRSAQFIANNRAELSESAAGIDNNSAEIARELSGLTGRLRHRYPRRRADDRNRFGIENLAHTAAACRNRDPLDNTVARLGRFVERLPDGRHGTPRSTRSDALRVD